MSDDKTKSTPAPAQPATSAPGGAQSGASAPAAVAPAAPAGPAGSPAVSKPKPSGPPPITLPPMVPFVAQPDRGVVDQGEPAADGSKPLDSDREWIGYAQQGGGKVPDDWSWPRSPKQEQDEAM